MPILIRGGKGWLRGWLRLLLVIWTACTSTVLSQEGYLSIDCGNTESYNDTSTGIFWETDANYTTTGQNLMTLVQTANSSDGPFINQEQSGTLRYFDDQGDSRNRDCYVLPVQQGETYLLRLTFYYGNIGTLTATTGSAFEIWVDCNNWLNLEWVAAQGSNSSAYYYNSDYYEFIYAAQKSTLDLCLTRIQGPSFISALELRQLAPGMYVDALGPTQSSWLFFLLRTNLGPPENGTTQMWRHPDDKYDRIWTLFGSGDNNSVISNPNISGSSNSFTQDPDQPPLVVMEDAWVQSDNAGPIQIDFTEVTDGLTTDSVYIATYFQELDVNASATNVRGMTYYLNNQSIESFNASDKPLEIHTIGNYGNINWTMSLVQADWSRLGPILNAYEMYAILPWSTAATAPEDVSALYAIQFRLGLLNWNGDPCLPTPYDWLTCSCNWWDCNHNSLSEVGSLRSTPLTPRITSLSLANQGLGGNFPIEIVNLTALTNLTLNNNNFTGPIPDFSSLVHLQAIYLQNNNFSGEIPTFLGTAFQNLTELNLDNNNLSGPVPSVLIKTGLNFTVLNNPFIVNCTVPACGYVPPAPPPVFNHGSSGTNTGAVVGGIFGGLAGVAIVAGIVWMLCTRRRRARLNILRSIEFAENQGSSAFTASRKALASSATLLTLQEVSDATKKFSKKIGEGSFGPVYYGKLSNGQEVAVKVKKTDSRQGVVEFLNEVELLSRIHHRNLVSLVGSCEEENQQILIYVYFSNGSLRDHLYGNKSGDRMDWSTRLDIALNSAKAINTLPETLPRRFDNVRGLDYLHSDCNPRIIHRDVKSSNILLDENMVAKVADFGISKQTQEGVLTGVETMLKGTIGYFDPEYFTSQRLTQKSDVYSFGVVLLEIISGRHPYVSEFPDGTTRSLIEWAHGAVNDGRPMDIVDPSLNLNFETDSMMTVISLSIRSVNPVTANRPNMAQVVRTIAEAIELNRAYEFIHKTDNPGDNLIGESSAVGKDEEEDALMSNIQDLSVSDAGIDASTVVLPR